jgi:hypothetical protein
VQQRCFAAAAAADEHHLFAPLYLEFGNIEDWQASAIGLRVRLFYLAELKHS